MDTPHPAEAAADRRASNAVIAVVGLAVVALALKACSCSSSPPWS